MTDTPATWTVRGATFALWALAAGSSAFWALKLGRPAAPLDLPLAAPRAVAAADPVAIARLLGSAPSGGIAAPVAAPSVASRFQLLGVAAGVHSGGGAAVISVDGKPGRPFRVGAQVDEGLVLKSVHGRQAVIAPVNGGAAITLELPAQRTAAAGTPPAPVTAPPMFGGVPPQAPIAAPR